MHNREHFCLFFSSTFFLFLTLSYCCLSPYIYFSSPSLLLISNHHPINADPFQPHFILIIILIFVCLQSYILGIAMVSCGVWHTVAVAKDTHDVYTWGWNKFGQCGTRPRELDPSSSSGPVSGDYTNKVMIVSISSATLPFSCSIRRTANN